MFKRMKKWLRRSDWNPITQEICAVLIGLALGLYGYESKVALLPLKWETNDKVAERVARESSRQKQAPKQEKHEQKSDSGFGGILEKGLNEGLDSALEEGLQQATEEIAKEIVDATGAESLLKYASEYSDVFDDLGVRGELKGQVEDLIRDGVEPVPKKWTSGGNQPFFVLAIVLLLTSLLAKFLIYLLLLDMNRLKNRIFKIRRRLQKRRVDWNGILQEIGTLGISAIGGLYLQPGLEDFLKGEHGSYPYPFAIIAIFLGCLFLKIAVSSALLDLSACIRSKGKKPLISPKRFRRFSHAYDWNSFVQQFCAIVISLGIGFYAYESNLALLPITWQTNENVAEDVAHRKITPKKDVQKTSREKPESDIFGDILGDGLEKGLKEMTEEVAGEIVKASGAENLLKYSEEYDQAFKDLGIRGGLKGKVQDAIRDGVKPMPDRWKDPANRPYLIIAFTFFLVCLTMKFAIYFHLLDFNRIIKHRKSSVHKGVDWDEILAESTTIIMGAVLGLYADPLMDALAGKTAGFPYPKLGPCIIVACLTLKFLMYLDIVRLTAVPSSPKRVPMRKGAPRKRKSQK